MKTFIRLFFIALIVPSSVVFTSCEKKTINSAKPGLAEFSVILPADINSKSGSDSLTASFQIMISVEDMAGNSVFADKLIPLYVFGTGFVSEPVEIEAGEYKLTKFMIINMSGAVVYAAPVEGSPLAYLSEKPLPLNFNILADQVTRVLPEVLAVGDQTPDKFGYASFGVQIIKPVDLWTMCVLDPGILMPPITITTAKLTIYAPDGWHYSFNLEAAVNHLVIRGGYESYTLVLEKEGYQAQRLQFSAGEIKATTKENPLVLTIPWSSRYNEIILQPGPEKGKDAMISNLEPNKNFGDYKYFEATYLTEPVLTVMRSNRSLIQFNLDTLPKSAVIVKVLLTLRYDIPIPFDSIYYTTNTSPVMYGAVLQQVVEPWEENKVTWNTQPKTIEANQVYIAPFIRNSNMITVDVTKLFVQPATSDGPSYPNYGMLFRTWPVDRFPGFRFASSDYPLTSIYSKMWPMLTIYYYLSIGLN
jgi:hypothetical protein